MGWGSKRDANGDRTHDGLGRPLDEEGKKFFRLRESGYTGPIDQNGTCPLCDRPRIAVVGADGKGGQ